MRLSNTKVIGLSVSTVLFFLLTGCGSGGSNDGASVVTPPPVVVEPEPPVEETPAAIIPFELPDEISPAMAVAEMKVGINLGNTLDAPNEGDWALPAQESFMAAFKNAGFKHVRIPVTWQEHVGQSAPYEIDADFLARVEEIVDWALAQDLYVILNAHHEGWLKNDYSSASNQSRFDNIWTAVAAHFKNKPAKLMYEMLNEPNGMTMANVNELNKRVLDIIRAENPNRLVVFSGNGFTPVDSLLGAEIPNVSDKFLIGNFHSYDPWGFAGQCQQSWGTDADRVALRDIYIRASDWAVVNQIPVMVNEFGAAKYDFTQPENICDLTERLDYLAEHVSLMSEFGVAGSFWDDGGSFSSYDRANNSWGPEKDVLVAEND
jgi:endoglucanase